MKRLLPIPLVILCFLTIWPMSGLLAENIQKTPDVDEVRGEEGKSGCLVCHPRVQLDKGHRFACSICHGGESAALDKESAHRNLLVQPAHPQFMQQTCGKCHRQIVESAQHSLHFTLKNKINKVRRQFGASQDLDNAAAVPVQEPPQTVASLADDMLRRRCLRCHPYASGDGYSAVVHGTGCASCHLVWKNREMESHVFQLPKDRQCLSCHYGNYVGWDYYGRYEHDFNWEYRTPYTKKTKSLYPPRPYGVEYHDLTPDIHQQRGLVCTDCHRQSGHNAQQAKLSCRSCHAWQPGQQPALANLQQVEGKLILKGSDDRRHHVPLLRHPAHEKFGKQVDCQVCHAQWSFNDSPVHLMRSEEVDYEMWEWLTVQGSSEVERLLEHNTYSSNELPLAMPDGLNGESRPGIWLKGYGQRRWEQMLIDRDSDGVIKVFRPIVNLHLSMVDEDGNVLFDNVIGNGSGKLPYVPHTTGHAGMLYLDRFQDLLPPSEMTSR